MPKLIVAVVRRHSPSTAVDLSLDGEHALEDLQPVGVAQQAALDDVAVAIDALGERRVVGVLADDLNQQGRRREELGNGDRAPLVRRAGVDAHRR